MKCIAAIKIGILAMLLNGVALFQVGAKESLRDLIQFVPDNKQENNHSKDPVEGNLSYQADKAAKTYPLKSESLLKALSQKIVDHYQLRGKLELAPLKEWQPVALPSEEWEIKITGYPNKLTSRFNLRFEILSDNHRVGEWLWPMQAKLLQQAYVSKKQINSRSPLSRELFKKQEFDALRLRKPLFPTSKTLTNHSARSTISAGKPLYKRDTEARTIVEKSSKVKVIAKRGGLKINMMGRALDDGAMGDSITVRNPKSNERISGKVIDDDTVLVQF